MRGHALSGSRKLNKHWQSGRRGFYPLRFWEWCSAWSFVFPQYFYKYRVRKYAYPAPMVDSLSIYIHNPFYPSVTTEKKPLYTLKVKEDGTYYFRIRLSLKSKPSYLSNIPLYFYNMRYGVGSGTIAENFISTLTTTYYSKKSKLLNVCEGGSTTNEQFTSIDSGDFIPDDRNLFEKKVYLLDAPIEIVTGISAKSNDNIIFKHRIYLEYKYNDYINGTSLPYETNTYYGYGLDQGNRIKELTTKNSGSFFDFNKLSSEEKKELLQLTNMQLDVKIVNITESEYQGYVKKYGADQ